MRTVPTATRRRSRLADRSAWAARLRGDGGPIAVLVVALAYGASTIWNAGPDLTAIVALIMINNAASVDENKGQIPEAARIVQAQLGAVEIIRPGVPDDDQPDSGRAPDEPIPFDGQPLATGGTATARRDGCVTFVDGWEARVAPVEGSQWSVVRLPRDRVPHYRWRVGPTAGSPVVACAAE